MHQLDKQLTYSRTSRRNRGIIETGGLDNTAMDMGKRT
jgi:hypothetical protein